MPQPILVIGGTGHTGRHIVARLREHGEPVRVLARNPETAHHYFDHQVELIEGDITNANSVATAMSSVKGCVIIVESAESDTAPNSPEHVHFEGTRNVLAAATEGNPHIVLVTQIYVTRSDRYPEMRNIIHWRGLAERTLRASGLPYTIVRPSWLVNEHGGRSAIRFEQGDTGEGQISREDVAEVCAQSLLIPEARDKTFEIYNAAGDPPTDWHEVFAALHKDEA